MASDHGTVTRYNGGCRCPRCREARSSYIRLRKAQGKEGRHKVVMIPTPTVPVQPTGPGGNETALLEQIDLLETVATTQPALVALAMTLAKILDDRTLPSLHPPTARQYRETLAELRKRTERSGGKLALVRELRRSTRDNTAGAS